MDTYVGLLKVISVEYRGRGLTLHSHITFVADGKLIELCCGSGGAVCTSCTKTKADHTNFTKIREGLPMDRTNEFFKEKQSRFLDIKIKKLEAMFDIWRYKPPARGNLSKE